MAEEKSGVKTVFNKICKMAAVSDDMLPKATIINWFREAGIIGKETGISELDVNKTIEKTSCVACGKLTFEELHQCIVKLAKEKKIDHKELMDKLARSDPPSTAEEKGGGSMEAVFDEICKTTAVSDGMLSKATIRNWFKEAGIINKKTGISESDVNKTIEKTVCKDCEKMTFEDLHRCAVNLAKEKKMDHKELMDKLASAMNLAKEKKTGHKGLMDKLTSSGSSKTAEEMCSIEAIFDEVCEKSDIPDGLLPKSTIVNWLKQAEIIGKKTGISESDVNKAIEKTACTDCEKLNVKDLHRCIAGLAKEKKMDYKTLEDKLARSGTP